VIQNPLSSQELSEIVDDIELHIKLAEEKLAAGDIQGAREWTWRAGQTASTARVYMDPGMPEEWRDRYDKKLMYYIRKASMLRAKLETGYSNNPSSGPVLYRNTSSDNPGGNGAGVSEGLRSALVSIVTASKARPGSLLDYAATYAMQILDGRVSSSDHEAMKSQILYILSNLGAWRGPEAVAARNTLKAALKEYGGYRDNPWLVAGPQVGLYPGQPGQIGQEIPQAGTANMIEATGMAKPAVAIPSPGQAVKRPDGRHNPRLSEDERARRSRVARRQRRTSGGKFYDNPSEFYRPNPRLPERESRFEKVYEESSKDGRCAAFVRYDSSWQLFTVRYIEEKEGKKTGLEVDVAAYPPEAKSMWRFVKEKGFTAFLKALKRAGRSVRAKRAYQEAEHALGVAPMGATPPVPSREDVYPGWGSDLPPAPKPYSGWGAYDPAPRRYPQVQSYPDLPTEQTSFPHPGWGTPLPPPPTQREEDDAIRSAIHASDQVAHEVGERDFSSAIHNLMRLRDIMTRATERKYRSAWHAIQAQWQRARSMIEAAWPGRIKETR
jgi:hypothetical protein